MSGNGTPRWYRAAGALLEPLAARAGQAGDAQAIRWRRGRDVPPATLWLHGASVGEAAGAPPLVDALVHTHPEERLVLSALTPGGRAALRRRLAPWPVVAPPVDSPRAVARALSSSGVRRLLLLETELWPSWIAGALARDVRIAVANARLSDRAWARTLRFRPWLAPLVSRFTAVAAQTEIDAQRWRELGAPAERVRVTGSTKFDAEPPRALDAEARAEARRTLELAPDALVCVWASLRPGEERWLAAALSGPRAVGLVHLVVPRHPERWPSGRRLGEGEAGVRWRAQLGILETAYRAADFVVMGGTMERHGGHNPIEAARLGLPVLLGPSLESVREPAAALLAEGGAQLVSDPASLRAAIQRWAGAAADRQRAGAGAERAAERLRGAAERTRAWLEQCGFWE